MLLVLVLPLTLTLVVVSMVSVTLVTTIVLHLMTPCDAMCDSPSSSDVYNLGKGTWGKSLIGMAIIQRASVWRVAVHVCDVTDHRCARTSAKLTFGTWGGHWSVSHPISYVYTHHTHALHVTHLQCCVL